MPESRRLRLALCFAVTLPLAAGAFALRGTPYDALADFAGGVLYVQGWIILVLALVPRLTPLPLSLAVLAGTCAVEVAQLWHPPLLEMARATLPGRILLGTTFAWRDFPAYGVGALAGWLIAARVASGRPGARK